MATGRLGRAKLRLLVYPSEKANPAPQVEQLPANSVETGSLSKGGVIALPRLAVHDELACLRNFALDEAENRTANLERALSSNCQIGAAIGILMAMHKLTSDRAFALLREASNKTNRRLRDVADQVVLAVSLDQGMPG